MSFAVVRPAFLALVAGAALACANGPVEVADPDATATHSSAIAAGHGVAGAAHGGRLDAAGNQWLARLRATTAKYQDFAAAENGTYAVEITPCSELPGTGGQGYHFGDPNLIDGVVEALAPELLMYEPQKNGRMKLVGVEYIVPFDLWPSTDPAPVLHGQPFHQNFTFNVWALHAWIWEHNPDGMFANWNPRVTCTYAPQD